MNMMLKRHPTNGDQSVAARGPAALRRLDGASPSDALAPGFTALLDGLRAQTARNGGLRALVLATPEPSPASGFVLDGLAARAEQLGMGVVRGELRGVPSRTLAPPRRTAAVDRSARHCFAVASRPDHLASEMDGWLAQHHGADLVLIEAPPLLQSIDGALVARACDGLVLIAERGVTERRALQEAASRARAAGCTLLGVIVTSSERPMPAWLERLAGPRRVAPSLEPMPR
jgi:hypothetical protein